MSFFLCLVTKRTQFYKFFAFSINLNFNKAQWRDKNKQFRTVQFHFPTSQTELKPLLLHFISSPTTAGGYIMENPAGLSKKVNDQPAKAILRGSVSWLCTKPNASLRLTWLEFLLTFVRSRGLLWGIPATFHRAAAVDQRQALRTMLAELYWCAKFKALIRGACVRKTWELPSWDQV